MTLCRGPRVGQVVWVRFVNTASLPHAGKDQISNTAPGSRPVVLAVTSAAVRVRALTSPPAQGWGSPLAVGPVHGSPRMRASVFWFSV